MGSTLADCRFLTGRRVRLASAAPNFAAVLRSILLRHPAVELIVRLLNRARGSEVSAQQLAVGALQVDEGLGMNTKRLVAGCGANRCAMAYLAWLATGSARLTSNSIQTRRVPSVRSSTTSARGV